MVVRHPDEVRAAYRLERVQATAAAQGNDIETDASGSEVSETDGEVEGAHGLDAEEERRRALQERPKDTILLALDPHGLESQPPPPESATQYGPAVSL